MYVLGKRGHTVNLSITKTSNELTIGGQDGCKQENHLGENEQLKKT